MAGGGFLRSKLFFCALAVTLLTQGFNGVLQLVGLEKLHYRSQAAGVEAAGVDFVREAETRLREGRDPVGPGGLASVLVKMKARDPDVRELFLASPSGAPLAQAGAETVPLVLGPPAFIPVETFGAGTGAASGAGLTVFKSGRLHYLVIPLKAENGTVLGQTVIGFDRDQATERFKAGARANLEALAHGLAAATMLLAVGLLLLAPSHAVVGVPKMRLYLVLVFCLAASQTYYGVKTFAAYKAVYLAAAKQKIETLGQAVQEDMEARLSKGVKLDKLGGMEAWLDRLAAPMEELSSLIVRDVSGRDLYQVRGRALAGEESPLARLPFLAAGEVPDLVHPLWTRNQKGERVLAGKAVLTYDVARMRTRLGEIVLDSATAALIAFLFLIEAAMIFLGYVDKMDAEACIAQGSCDEESMERFSLIRPVGFGVVFALDMSLAFIPLQMESLPLPNLSVSREVMLGLPISAEMFFAGLAVLGGGFWMERRGRKAPLALGAVLAAVGSFLSAKSPDAWSFILARGATGLGYGLMLMAAQGLAAAGAAPAKKGAALAHLFAGVYAGSICGAAAGGMIADRLGRQPVFLAAAAILLLVGLPAALFLRDPKPKRTNSDALLHPTPRTVGGRELLGFVFNREMGSLILFNILPGALFLIGFLNYLTPIHLTKLGRSQADIGRVMMLYGVCLIYLAPAVGSLIDASGRKKPWIFLSGVLGAVGMASFNVLSGIWAPVFAVFMFGLAGAVGFAAQSAYALNLPATARIGEGRAMGLYGAAERIGQVLGPLVLARLTLELGMQGGMVWAGAAYLGLTLLFLLLAREHGAAL